MNIFQRNKFSTHIFVIAALASFILLWFLFFLFKTNLYLNFADKEKNKESTQYYFNEKYDENDPLITKAPNLDNILAGPIINDVDPSVGAKDAKVIIVEFSDYQCSYCMEQEKVFKKIVDKYSENLRLIWKDYPESDIDSVSWKSAVAARCAQEQGKFWEYHDLLYTRIKESNVDEKFFSDLAGEVGLKIKTFDECLSDNEIKKLIKDNILEARALDISGIPFVYINNQEVMGEVSFEDLEKIIKIEFEN